MNTLDHKCPACNAVLKFNPHNQNWKCEYCRNEYNLDEIQAHENKIGRKELKDEQEVKMMKDQNGMDVYSCPNCGAQIIADENTAATSCVYCRNTAILKNKLVGEFNPSMVIPFKFTKEDAVESFKKIGKGRPLMPKIFNDKKNIEDMKGIYIPFWLYDIDTNGSIEADCKRIRSWTTGDRRYTKTDTYFAKRSGNMEYYKIPVDGSKKFADDIMNSIEPFDYNELKEFSHSYLSGFLAEKYDVLNEEAIEIALKRAESSTIKALKNDINGYNVVNVMKNNITTTKKSDAYVMLPVWLLNIKYKGKIRTFAMNGQTGKMIGDIPVDTKRAVIWWIIMFLAVFTIITIGYFIGVI